jgi:hypothetical protein
MAVFPVLQREASTTGHSRTQFLLLLLLPPPPILLQSGAVERSKLTSVTSHAEFIDSKFSCPSASARAQHDDRNLFNDAPLPWG